MLSSLTGYLRKLFVFLVCLVLLASILTSTISTKTVFAEPLPLRKGCYDNTAAGEYKEVDCKTSEQEQGVAAGKCYKIWGISGSRGTKLFNSEINCTTGVTIQTPTGPLADLSDVEYENTKRELYNHRMCLGEVFYSIFDFDDELTNDTDIFHKVEDLSKQNVPVGLDLDNQNGVAGCLSIMIKGFNLVDKINGGPGNTVNQENFSRYVTEKIVGKTVNWSAGAISTDGATWSQNLENLKNEASQAVALLVTSRTPNPVDAYRVRALMLATTCYDVYNIAAGTAPQAPDETNLDFVWGGGVFMAKDSKSSGDRGRRSDILGTVDGGTDVSLPLTKVPYVTAGPEGSKWGGGENRDLSIADFKLDFEFDAGEDQTNAAFMDNTFYPMGIDITNSETMTGKLIDIGGSNNGFTSCNWLKKNVASLLEGITVAEDGSLVGITEEQQEIITDVTEEQKNAAAPPAGKADPTCESEGGVTAWVICPFINMASNGIDWIEKEIQGYLDVDSNFLTQEKLKAAWTNIRNIAYALLIPIMLVMVIGTALGFDFVSAYTVKRALPRMIAAVMFITFSWYICGYLINFFNVVGAGISGLMEGPFAGTQEGGKLTLATLFSVNGAGNSVATAFESLAFGAAVGVGAIALIFFFLPTFLLSIAVGWLVLTVRQVLIVALVMLAPVAILAWIFPGNDKLWKLWKGSFTKLLIMYPLIMMLISAGHIMAFLVNESGNGGPVNFILRTGMWCVPYLFIPATFKFAGGALATIAGVTNDKTKGLFDRSRNKRATKLKDFKAGSYTAFGKKVPGMNRLGAGLGAGVGGRFGFGNRGRAKTQQNAAVAAQDTLKNNPALQELAFNDDGNAVMALSGGTEAGAKTAAAALEAHWVKQAEAKNGGPLSAEEREKIRQRAARAHAAAAAVGFNRLSAQAALTTMAQNKSRAIGAGEDGRELIEQGIRGLADGNDAAASSLRNGFQYHSRNAGRYDLGGNSAIEAAKKASLYQLANSDAKTIESLGAEHIANGDMEALAIHEQELKAMLPNATGSVAEEIQKQLDSLEGHAGLQTWKSTPTGKTRSVTRRVEYNDSDPSHKSWSAEERRLGFRMENDTWQETNGHTAAEKSRRFNNPDPNNL